MASKHLTKLFKGKNNLINTGKGKEESVLILETYRESLYKRTWTDNMEEISV